MPTRTVRLPRKPSTHTHSGITLIELLVTVAIVAIVLALAAPPFSEMVAENRMATTVNSFVSSLQLARSEAAKRSRDVRVCVSTDNEYTTCEGDADQWHERYVVIADPEGASEVLRVQTGTVQITISGEANDITYTAQGTARADIEFAFEDITGSADCRVVSVSSVGHVSTTRKNGNACPE